MSVLHQNDITLWQKFVKWRPGKEGHDVLHHKMWWQENRQIHALEEEDHGRIGSQQQDYDYQSSQQEDSENQCSGLKWQHLMWLGSTHQNYTTYKTVFTSISWHLLHLHCDFVQCTFTLRLLASSGGFTTLW